MLEYILKTRQPYARFGTVWRPTCWRVQQVLVACSASLRLSIIKAMTIYTHLRQKKLASIASLPDTPNATTENMNRYAAIW